MDPKEKAVAEIKELSKAVTTELLAADRAKHDAKLADIDAKIAAMEADIQRKAVSVPGCNEEPEAKTFFGKLVYALDYQKKCGSWPEECGFQREVMHETAKAAGKTVSDNPNTQMKVMMTAPGSAGGYTIAEEFSTEIINQLMDEALLKTLGAQFLTGLKGSPVKMPAKTAGSTTYMVGESGSPTASDLTLAQETMEPHKMATLVKITNRLEYLSLPSVEALIRQDIAESQGLKMDTQVFRGTGASNELLGLTNIGGNLNTVNCGTGGNGGAVAIDKLYSAISQIEIDKALKGKLAWVFHPRTLNTIKQFKGTETYFMMSQLQGGLGAFSNVLLSYPWFSTGQIPATTTVGTVANCTEFYFGNWMDALVGIWRNMEIKLLDQASDSSANNAALLDQLWFLAFTDFDWLCRHDQSFCVCTDCSS